MHPSATTARPRCSAWLLVLVYLLGMPGIAPAAVASLAAISGEHEVRIAMGDGHVDVLLHHPDDHHAHVHGGLAEAITGIPAHDEEDDHLLHFANSSEALSISSTNLNVASATLVCVQWHGISFHPRRPAREAMQRHAARPPPLASIGMLCLRTTVLLV